MKYIVNFTVSEGKLNGFLIQYIILRMPSQKSCNVFLAWTLLTEASRYRYIWFRHICHLFVIRYSVLIMTADLTYSWILMFCFIQKANWFRNHYSGSGSWTTTEQKAATRLFHLSRVPVVVEPSYRLHSEHFCARRWVVPWFALFCRLVQVVQRTLSWAETLFLLAVRRATWRPDWTLAWTPAWPRLPGIHRPTPPFQLSIRWEIKRGIFEFFILFLC